MDDVIKHKNFKDMTLGELVATLSTLRDEYKKEYIKYLGLHGCEGFEESGKISVSGSYNNIIYKEFTSKREELILELNMRERIYLGEENK